MLLLLVLVVDAVCGLVWVNCVYDSLAAECRGYLLAGGAGNEAN